MFDLKRNATILLLALVGVAGIAGCGGGDEEEAPAPAPVEETTEAPELTQNELISQGDDYCAEVNAAVGTINSSTADESVKETQVSGIYSGLAEQLQDLGVPTEGEAPTDVIDAAQALAESDSTTASSALATFQSAADAYGFTECGEAPVAPTSSGTTTEVPSDSGDSTGGYVEPAPVPVEPAPVPVEPTAPPAGAGGGVAPGAPVDPGTGGSGGSSGSSSGGISPG